MRKLTNLINEYELRVAKTEADIKVQKDVVRIERTRCKDKSIIPSDDRDFVWESRDLRALQNKRLLLIQVRTDLESLKD